MASLIYNSYKIKVLNGANIDMDTDTIKVALVTSAYVPADAHDFFDDITNEVGASGTYSAGGVTLAGKAVTQDDTNNIGVFDANDFLVTGATITARAAILYKSTGTPSTSPLIAYIDFGSDKSSSAGAFVITWTAPASGGVFYTA